MTRRLLLPEGKPAWILSQEEASQRMKSRAPRARWAAASFSGLQPPCSKMEPKLLEISRTTRESFPKSWMRSARMTSWRTESKLPA